jgi:hypothetical protein
VNWPAIIARCISCSAVSGLAAVQWLVTTPGVITFLEYRTLLLVGAVGLTVTLSASWVSNAPKHPDRYTDREEQRVIRPPWS